LDVFVGMEPYATPRQVVGLGPLVKVLSTLLGGLENLLETE